MLSSKKSPGWLLCSYGVILAPRVSWAFYWSPVLLQCSLKTLVALGGWIVTFMLRVRSATPHAAGLSATGFWAGMTVGRALLGFITDRFGERICVMIYLGLAIGLELVFWLVPSFVVFAVAVAFLGFVFGPLFPAAVIMCTKLLPQHLHVASIGFATALGGSGGAVFPFAVGAIAQSKGVEVLQPIIMALLAAIFVVWLLLPRVPKQK
jgi:fucose permease